jgi:hypothetical protein
LAAGRHVAGELCPFGKPVILSLLAGIRGAGGIGQGAGRGEAGVSAIGRRRGRNCRPSENDWGGAPQGRRERGYVDEPTIGAQSLAGQRQMGSAKRTDMVNDRAIVTFACFPTLVDKHMQYA